MSEIFLRIWALIAAVSIAVYWGAVVVKLVRLARKIGKDPNAMPRERVGQWMRVLWYPVVIVMILQAWLVGLGVDKAWQRRYPGLEGWITPPSLLRDGGVAWILLGALATVICVAGTVYTFICWRKMGRSWRIGIDPNETLELVSSGPYRWVRHPIYATRMVIDVAAWVMAPTGIMGVVCLLDILLMQIEARREERYMQATHGPVYEQYKKRVGRFLPRRSLGVE